MKACPTPAKRCHASESAAWAEARATQARDASHDVLPYRCVCGSWHVGHNKQSLTRRIRRATRRGRR
jgi:maleate cis-trans isomerase